MGSSSSQARSVVPADESGGEPAAHVSGSKNVDHTRAGADGAHAGGCPVAHVAPRTGGGGCPVAHGARSGGTGPRRVESGASSVGSAGGALPMDARVAWRHMTEGVVTITNECVIQVINPAISKMFGYTSGELLGRNVSILCTEEHRAAHDSYVQRYLDTRIPHVVGISSRRLRAQRKDGSTFAIELTMTETHGGFVGMIRDVSAEQALREELNAAEAVTSMSVDAVVTVCGGPTESAAATGDVSDVPPLGTVVTANQAVKRLLGYEPSDLVGCNVSVIVSEPHRSVHDTYLRRYIATGQHNIIGEGRLVKAVRRDGSLVDVFLNVSEAELSATARSRTFVGILRDVSSFSSAISAHASSIDRTVDYDTPADEALAALRSIERLVKDPAAQYALAKVRAVLVTPDIWSPDASKVVAALNDGSLDEATRTFIAGSLSQQAQRRGLSRPGSVVSEPTAAAALRTAGTLPRLDTLVRTGVDVHGSSYDAFDVLALEADTAMRGDGVGVYGAFAEFVFRRHGLYESCGLSEATVRAFGRVVDAGYKRVPFHSSTHAADVAQTAHVLVSSRRVLPFMSPIHVLSLLVAASIHDFDHPGVNNSFLVNTGDRLALLHNDQSVLERHHASSAFQAMRAGDGAANVLSSLGASDAIEARRLVVALVLATDMAHHLANMGSLKAKLRTLEAVTDALEEGDPTAALAGDLRASASSPGGAASSEAGGGSPPTGGAGVGAGAGAGAGAASPLVSVPLASSPGAARVELSQDDVEVVLYALMKASDISHPSKPWRLHRVWSRRITEEFFAQGDRERAAGMPCSPLCDRQSTNVFKSQVGFISFVVRPFFEAVVRVIGSKPDPAMARGLLEQIDVNRARWQGLADAETPQEAFFRDGAAMADEEEDEEGDEDEDDDDAATEAVPISVVSVHS